MGAVHFETSSNTLAFDCSIVVYKSIAWYESLLESLLNKYKLSGGENA